MNANGTVDIVWNRQSGFTEAGYPEASWIYLDLTKGVRPNLLKQIENGIGRVTTIEYKSSTDYLVADRENGRSWIYKVPFPVNVVSRIEVYDGRNSTYSRVMSYHDGYYDGEEKEFRGFGEAEQKDLGDTSAPDLIMAYTYDTGAETEALKGKPLTIEAKNSDNLPFYQETYAWTTKILAEGIGDDEREVIFAFQTEKLRDVLEKGAGTPVQLKWEYAYDDYGNMTRQVEHGRLDGSWDDERVTEIDYTASHDSGKTNWILDKVCVQKTFDELGAPVSEKQTYYDGSAESCAVIKGNLTLERDWVSGNEYVDSIRNDYDTYGNIIATYDPLFPEEPGHYREFVYDTTYKTFPIEEHIHTGQTTLVMTATYDFGWGAIISSTGFNEHTTMYGYDNFGRLTAITKPPDTGHTVEYEYVLAHDLGNGKMINWVETRQNDGSSDGFLKSRTFYDGMGRKIMTRSEGEDSGQMVVTDTVQFNARKLPWKKYLPYFESGGLGFVEPTFNSGFTEHQYDALGREVRVNQPVGPEGVLYSTTRYQPLSKTVRDEEQTRAGSKHAGCGMRYVEDGLQDKDGNGRLREVYEIVKLSDTGEPLGSTVEWKTSYSYDLLDKLTGYTDSQQNQKIMDYDGLGRKTFMNDPDRGHMYYTYDEASNLIKTIDAKNQTIKYTYEGVNRLSAEYYGAGKVQPDVIYHYDLPGGPVHRGDLWQGSLSNQISNSLLTESTFEVAFDLNSDGKIDVADVVMAAQNEQHSVTLTAQNTRGFLSWVEDQSGEEHNSYDARGRVEWVIKRIKDSGPDDLKNYFTSMDYDSMDRVTTLTYPDTTKVTYTYNNRGLLESVPNVINTYDYNPAGQNALLSLACGTTTTYDYDHRLRLSRLKTVRLKDTITLQNLAYTYDGVSNITTIIDGRTKTELDTIGSELGIAAAEARKFNSTQSFNYDSLYRLTNAQNENIYGNINYRYDRIGNMITKSAYLLEPDPLMDLGTMTSGGTGSNSGRIGRSPGDPPGPHAITATEKGPTGPMLFDYDDNGNMKTVRGMTLNWDYKDRLSGLLNNTKSAEYTYDYTDTRRMKRVEDSDNRLLTKVIYIDKFSEVRDGALIKYVYAGNNRIGSSDSTDLSYKFQVSNFYLHDHSGSTNIVITETEEVNEENVYFPFGHQRKSHIVSTVGSTSIYKFVGKELDEESGLQYFGKRFYDPYTSSFVSTDLFACYPQKDKSRRYNIINKPKNFNLYSYTTNNPIIFLDPDGLWKVGIQSSGSINVRGFTLIAMGGEAIYDSTIKSMTYKGELTYFAIQGSIDSDSKGSLSINNQDFGLNLGPAKFRVSIKGEAGSDGGKISLAISGRIGMYKGTGQITIDTKAWESFKKTGDLNLVNNAEFTFKIGVGADTPGIAKGVKAEGEAMLVIQAKASELKEVYEYIKTQLNKPSSNNGRYIPQGRSPIGSQIELETGNFNYQ